MELINQNAGSQYGQLISQSRAEKLKVQPKMLFVLLPALFLLVMGIVLLFEPYVFGDVNIIWAYIFVILGIGITSLVIWGRRIGRQYDVDVFENGFVIRRDQEIISLGFSELEGIAYLGSSIQYRGKPISFAKTRNLIIIPKSGADNAIEIVPFKLSNFYELSEILDIVYTYYLLKDIKREDINSVRLSFGEQLKLVNGKLVYNEGEKEVPIMDIVEMVVNYSDYSLVLYDEKEKALTVALDKVYNQSSLQYLTNFLQGKKELSIRSIYERLLVRQQKIKKS